MILPLNTKHETHETFPLDNFAAVAYVQDVQEISEQSKQPETWYLARCDDEFRIQEVQVEKHEPHWIWLRDGSHTGLALTRSARCYCYCPTKSEAVEWLLHRARAQLREQEGYVRDLREIIGNLEADL